MSTKKVRRPKTVIPTQRSYDLDTILGSRGGGSGFGGGDELDDAMRQARKFQADKMKSTIIKKTQLEFDKEIQDMEKGMNTGSGGGSGMLTPEEMNYIMKFPEEQRSVAIQSMAAFRSGTKNDSTGNLAPMLVMSMLNKQPQTGVGELVVALKGLNDIVQTGKAPTSNIDSVVSIARLLLEFKDKDQTTVTDLYKEILKERSVDPIQQTESVVNLAKSLGMSPAGGMNPEVERMKIQSSESMQQRQHDHELALKNMERQDERLVTIINAISGPIQQLAAAFAPGLAAAAGGAAGAALAQKPRQGGPIPVKCPKCGYEPIWVSEDSPIALCPNCKNGGVDTAVTHPGFKQQPPGSASPVQGPGPGVPPPPSG